METSAGLEDVMNNPYWDAFFKLHRDLPREGPGEDADVAWAAQIAGLREDARICDAACGPGADIPALLKAAPQGHVVAMDKVDHFAAQAQALYGHDPRTQIFAGDMTEIEGPFDFIWCAGAVYFIGIKEALRLWRPVLSSGGAIAFSQVCWLTAHPSERARAGWADYADMTDEAGVREAIETAGYECIAERRLSDAAWENYYTPLDQRIAALREGAAGALADVLDEAEAEAGLWRGERTAFGYLLCVVRPK